ncbi:DUF947 domain-containing protein [archaeon]|nr:MAG: DUF947 domain-containing protein [archaeon]
MYIIYHTPYTIHHETYSTLYTIHHCRFADYTGELNQKIYAKNYSFLEDYRESEIQQLSAALKRAKGSANEEEIKHELLVYVLFACVESYFA